MGNCFGTFNCILFRNMQTNFSPLALVRTHEHASDLLSTCRTSIRSTHITLEVISFPRVDDVILVGQARPLMKEMFIVHIADQGLTFLGQDDAKHVHRAAVSSLVFLKLFLVLEVTHHFGNVKGPHHLGVVMDCSGTNVVTQLLTISFFVFVLKERTGERGGGSMSSSLLFWLQ